MTEEQQAQRDLIQQLCDDQLRNEKEIREGEERTFQLRLKRVELQQLLVDYQHLRLAAARERLANAQG